ncbi:MAG: hypothetical protein HUJ76_12600, partial [Parasporobacterium sp.]|nr:hypothetical protein [Parasporobacterium sp.]
MDIRLEPGKTVIDTRTARDPQNRPITVDIIYLNENTGYIRKPDGVIETFDIPQYRDILAEFRKRAEKNSAVDSVINSGHEQEEDDEEPVSVAEEDTQEEQDD